MLADDVVCYRSLERGVNVHWRRQTSSGTYHWVIDDKKSSIDSCVDNQIVIPLLTRLKEEAVRNVAAVKREIKTVTAYKAEQA